MKNKLNTKKMLKMIGLAFIIVVTLSMCTALFGGELEGSKQNHENKTEQVKVDKAKEEKAEEKAQAKEEAKAKADAKDARIKSGLLVINGEYIPAIVEATDGAIINAIMERDTYMVMVDEVTWGVSSESEKASFVATVKAEGTQARLQNGLDDIYTLRVMSSIGDEVAINGVFGKTKIRR